MNLSQLGSVPVNQQEEASPRPRGAREREREDFRQLVKGEPDRASIEPITAFHNAGDGNALEPTLPHAGGAAGIPMDAIGAALYEWQATSHYLLSQLFKPAQRTVDSTPLSTRGEASAGVQPQGNALQTPLLKSDSSTSVAANPGALGNHVAPVTSLAEWSEVTDATVAARTTALVGRDRWSDRSIRRVVNADGKLTIWVRDYRLDPQATAELIDDLISGEAGQSPERVMLNGAEVWRRPTKLSGVKNDN